MKQLIYKLQVLAINTQVTVEKNSSHTYMTIVDGMLLRLSELSVYVILHSLAINVPYISYMVILT